ncbi:MAG: hypothetical protein ACYC9O_20875, partial [Candidatus Latescibacterota bacterium]
MPAPERIIELIDRFHRNRDDYHSGNNKETRLRREFIDFASPADVARHDRMVSLVNAMLDL